MIEPLPCPFCGHVGVSFVEGSTFRWLLTACDECGATAGETRKRTLPPLDEEADKRDAIENWNRRVK
jgi:Lar family restriction alleviation protein